MAVRAKSAGTERKRGAAAPIRRKAAARPKRDPEAMQRRILEAATTEFASHGYGGARVERISGRAGTVDRMLYYYFGSKEGLFRAVLEGVYERLGEAEQQLHLTETDRSRECASWSHSPGTTISIIQTSSGFSIQRIFTAASM
jgi:AcrR family transcriptional regulator